MDCNRRIPPKTKVKCEDRRLCLKNVPIDMDKVQLMTHLCLKDFERVSVYSNTNTHNQKLQLKLVFLDFERPW